MDENTKVSIKNLTNHAVGFGCVNYPQHFNFQPGQVVPIKWEYVSDAAFDYGFRYMIENSYLKIMPNNQNYAEIMEELQFTHLMEKIEKSLSYEDIKAIFRIKPLSTQYSKIKKILKEGSETEKKNVAEVIIAKQRSGSTGTVELAWLPSYTKFANLDRHYSEEEE